MRAAEASSQEQHQCVTSNTRVTQGESCPLPPTCSATHLFWKPRPTLHTLQNMVGFQLESELGARKMASEACGLLLQRTTAWLPPPMMAGSQPPATPAPNHLQAVRARYVWNTWVWGSRLLLSIPKPPILLVPIISDQQYSHYNSLVSWVRTVRTVA